MNPARGVAPTRDTLHAVLRVVLLYAVFAGLWILLSDGAVAWLFRDPDTLRTAGSLKGLAFVVVTSLLLFFLLLRFGEARPGHGGAEEEEVAADGAAARPGGRMLFGGVALLAVVFALLGASGMLQSAEWHRATAGEQLQSIAGLKVAQLENWLEERRRDTEVVRTAFLFREALPKWRVSGDAAARQRLLVRLEDFRVAMRYQSVAVCDSRGEILLQAGAEGHGSSDELRGAVQRAIASGEVQITDLYAMADPGPPHVHLDFVAPVPPAPGETASSAAVVLRADVDATLYPVLQSWPVPSASAETLLFRAEGNDVLFLNELRHRAGTALQLRLPVSERKVLAVQALAPDYRPGTLIDGVDYRGVPVIGLGQPVAGTPWWMIAKVDRDEIMGAVHRDALWIVLSTLLTWAVAVTLAMLALQRRELAHARQRRREQAERMQALSLLAAIADASADAIFAKDLQGRYLLFNRAACAFTGKSEADVLGQDDTVLFPAGQAEMIRANDRRVIDEGRLQSYEERLDTAVGPRTFLAVKGPLRDDAGRVIGMYGISRDISARAETEDVLRRSNDELERFNRAVVGRELDMVRLKREVNALAAALGRPAPYDLAAIDPDMATMPSEGPQEAPK